MTVENWLKLYKALRAGATIKDVIYDDSKSLSEQTSVQLMLDRDTFITVEILKGAK